ncbi:MAG: GNAT family N-acetyltransferase [Halocynthiibacter sp.]
MTDTKTDMISFVRLTEVPEDAILQQMNDPRVSQDMPLLKTLWDISTVRLFVRAKEAMWKKDGLGHWAILHKAQYIGWGGFQKEGNEWDFGLVLTHSGFGHGFKIWRKAMEFAKHDKRIPYITFLLPPSRRNIGAVTRCGAVQTGEITYDGSQFLKFRVET